MNIDDYDLLREKVEGEILNAGYTYQDIDDARDVILAVTSEAEKEARKTLFRYKKDRLALLFYLVGKMDGLLEGFRRYQ